MKAEVWTPFPEDILFADVRGGRGGERTAVLSALEDVSGHILKLGRAAWALLGNA